MGEYFYDLHIHTCLSPCADDDMTPANIANMAALKGLDVIAVTDHNSCKNAAAAVLAGQKAGILVLPGMELCTAEDIHCVCVFSGVGGAEAFGAEVRSRMPEIKNRPDIFGRELVMDENDEIVSEEEIYLLSAAAVGVDEVRKLAVSFGGAAMPAHIDREANGILAALGGIPPEAGFRSAEVSARCAGPAAFLAEHCPGQKLRLFSDSDAHTLGAISERDHSITLPGPLTPQAVVALINGG